MVAAVKGSDLNPDFSFDFGASAAQAPWEMSGTKEDVALGSMLESIQQLFSLFSGAAAQAMPSKGSTLDDKIQQRVQALKRRGTSKYTPEVPVHNTLCTVLALHVTCFCDSCN